jgi:hypothetical protein
LTPVGRQVLQRETQAHKDEYLALLLDRKIWMVAQIATPLKQARMSISVPKARQGETSDLRARISREIAANKIALALLIQIRTEPTRREGLARNE